MRKLLSIMGVFALLVVGMMAYDSLSLTNTITAIKNEITSLLGSNPDLPPAVTTPLGDAVTNLNAAITALAPPPPSDPYGVGLCGESNSRWHPPVLASACDTQHEHGDMPADWADAFSNATFGHLIVYGGDEASSPMENTMKHRVFKGLRVASAGGTDIYYRYHAGSNPADRAARYHSYELYAKDRAGNISFFQGWYDTGDPVANRFPRINGDPGVRPAILVVDLPSWNAFIRFEQWYAFASRQGGFGWDTGIGIGNSTTLFNAGENATAMDQSTWVVAPDHGLGLTRRIDGFWYVGRGNPPLNQWFCARPEGQIVARLVASPTECAVGSLPQFIASTLQNDARVEFGTRRVGFLVQKAFPIGAQGRLPN